MSSDVSKDDVIINNPICIIYASQSNNILFMSYVNSNQKKSYKIRIGWLIK